MTIHSKIILCVCALYCIGCQHAQKVDYIIKDAHIYTLNSNNDTAQAMAVYNHKIVAIGSNEEILNKYTADSIVSLSQKYVYPAFIDAHAHLFGLAYFLGECNLYGCRSVKEVIDRLKQFHQKHPHKKWLIGRGWDQNLFPNPSFPDKDALDSVFADIPVYLTRVDGHAIWTNTAAMKVANITPQTQIEGGDILLKNDGTPSGIFIDNATMLIEQHIPTPSRKECIELLKQAEQLCFQYHIHTICDAGLEKWQIELLDSLQQTGNLNLRIYAMALWNNENAQWLLHNGWIDKEKLKVKAFKIYADGALGSRGALLKQPYSDIQSSQKNKYTQNPYGLLLIKIDSLRKILKELYTHHFQVCTHTIGDSANKLILQLYAEYLNPNNDKRWRIEHAQVVDTNDLHYFKTYRILPSVQPTHAISDKNWAIERLGKNRITRAYIYQSLWKQNQILPLGTDFPVEEVSPLKTFFAAVFRCNYDLKDSTVFQPTQRLSRTQALRGMTIDAAYSAFMEKEIGSLEPNKCADFIVLDIDLMKIDKHILSRFILQKP